MRDVGCGLDESPQVTADASVIRVEGTTNCWYVLMGAHRLLSMHSPRLITTVTWVSGVFRWITHIIDSARAL